MCRHTERYIIKKQTNRQPNNRCMCILQTDRLNDILIDNLRQMCRHLSKNLQIDLPKNKDIDMWIDIHTDKPADEHSYTDINRKATAIHSHTRTHTHTHTHRHTPTRTHTHTHTYIYIYIYIYIYERTHAHTPHIHG